MSRFFGRRVAVELAVTLLVVLGAVSVVDIDDYGVHRSAMTRDPGHSAASGAAPRVSVEMPAHALPSDHVCACLLCTVTIPDSTGIRVLPPSAGKFAQPLSAGIADSPHPPEVFHPPSA